MALTSIPKVDYHDFISGDEQKEINLYKILAMLFLRLVL